MIKKKAGLVFLLFLQIGLHKIKQDFRDGMDAKSSL
jgi:hypothetical protein